MGASDLGSAPARPIIHDRLGDAVRDVASGSRTGGVPIPLGAYPAVSENGLGAFTV
jgi:hypothetical protein